MLTASKPFPIIFVKDKETRDTMIDKLSETDKKAFFKVMVEQRREAAGTNIPPGLKTKNRPRCANTKGGYEG